MNNLFENIRNVAILPSIHPNEKPVREFIVNYLEKLDKIYKIDKVGNLHVFPQSNSKILLSAHMDKQESPNFKDLGSLIQGKLDDAVGIGIILTLAERNNFYAFFSVGEEKSQVGSVYALNNGLIPKLEKAIVIDTSPWGEMEKGPIFYTSFDNKNPSRQFLEEIFHIANLLNVNLQPMDGFINDGINLIKAIPDTIALEPHIDNYHTSQEISSKKDIKDTYQVIEQYIGNQKEK